MKSIIVLTTVPVGDHHLQIGDEFEEILSSGSWVNKTGRMRDLLTNDTNHLKLTHLRPQDVDAYFS